MEEFNYKKLSELKTRYENSKNGYEASLMISYDYDSKDFHEKNISNYGFDPIEMMADARSDFLNLGYTHSTITINSPTTYLGSFDIHHPDGFDFPIKLEEDGIDINEMNSYLDDIYSSLGKDRDESYIDIFGHTHVNQFNYPGGYCYIPSYFDGGSKRGACHLRIYFDNIYIIKY